MSDMKINDRAVAFVSDWRERTEEQQRKYLILSITSFVLAFILCFLLFYWFQNRNYLRIVNQNMQYIQDSAIQEANQIEKEMDHGRMMIINLASQYGHLERYGDEMTIEERLRLLGDKNIFDRIAFISTDGMDVSLEGVADVSDRDYFRNAMNGETGWELVEKSRVTGKSTVIFYTPVIVENEIIGVMAGFYERTRLEELFSYQLFNFVPRSYLLMGDGTMVACSSEGIAADNMLDVLAGKTYEGEVDYDEICHAIEDMDRTTITFRFIDGSETSIGVLIQFNDSDWMLLSILPHSVTNSMVTNANRMGMYLLIAIVIVFLALILVLSMALKRQRDRLKEEMDIASQRLEASVKDEAKQLSIIESLGNIYTSIYYIDIANAKYRRIKEQDKSALNIPDTGGAETGFAAYVESFVRDADQKAIGKFMDIDTLKKRLQKDGSFSIEYQRADEGWRRAYLTVAERDEKDNIISAVFAVQPIDQEKRTELQTKRALEEAYEAVQMASNAKTAFLSNMSHDIRTPMNAIVGMTAIASVNLDNTEKVADCLKKITSSSKHLLGLINEVLDMSKIESGKVDLNEEEFCLSDLIDNLISINQALIKEKNHSLMVKVNNLTHEKVIGDSTRLQQVFTNLLSNAIKYTPENGKIEITISEKVTNKPTIGWYEVSFKDNGIGMSEEFQKNLFEPFSRAKDDRIMNIQGTGLGMPIAKNIIKMMNGDITVESKINEGTKFTVTFILRLQSENEINYDNFIDLSVLVVDDDVTACESTCSILDSLSMKSEWVTSGKEAVAKAVERHEKEEDYYAVIVDWKMPDMNGVDTARAIRKQVGDDIPIIVMSAYDWTDIEQEARAAGVNAFLSKPLFKTRIVELFNNLLGQEDSKAVSDLKENLNRYNFSGKRILLVEDNELNREMAVELLGMVGLETETAENGKIGTEKFSASKPGYYDLILMDIQMPVMNGYDAATAIRAMTHPDARKIPIIAMTANAFTADVRAAYNAGMNGHIAKPIDVGRLVKVINENLVS